MAVRIRSIFRYPVKGLGAQRLSRTDLHRDQPILGDRRFAIENGPSGFDPGAPKYLPKNRFLMLMRNERLAQLIADFDDEGNVISLRDERSEVARGDLSTEAGRSAIEAFFQNFMPHDLRGMPRVLSAPHFSFSDVSAKVISIVNLATIAEIENAVQAPVNPLRFRANLYIEGWPAWHEFTLVKSEVAIGPTARVNIVKRIERCAATNVDPETGRRDLRIPDTLMRRFGHTDCGVYARVTAAGAIATGDRIEAIPMERTRQLPI